MKRKLFLLLLLAALLFNLSACSSQGSSAQPASSNTKENTEETGPKAESAGVEYWDFAGQATENAYEIVYQNAEVFATRFSYGYVRAFVGIKNISPYPLQMGTGAKATVYTEDGTVVAEPERFHMDLRSSEILLPGETGYYYNYSSIDGLTEGTKLVCEPQIGKGTFVYHEGVGTLEENYNFYDVDNVSISYATDSNGDIYTDRLLMSGTLTNSSDETSKTIYIYSVGFDSTGKPVCFFMGSLDDIPAGESAAFEMRAEVYGSAAPEDIASFTDVSAFAFK